MKRLFKYALTIAAMSGLMAAPVFGQTEIHVLDVGQGLSVLVESQGHYMLYDGGDRNKSSFVVAYLKEEKVDSLDYVIASHYDADHLNGVVGALNVFPVKQVFSPDYTTDTRVFNSFHSVIDTKSIDRKQPKVGAVYQLGDASFQILSPSGDDYSDPNNYSIGIRITDGDSSFLITGDAESDSESEICKTKLELESDVYVMGHHGSGTSTSWELLQKTTPEYAVLSCGTGNTYGHPHIESMEKLQDMDIQLLRTDKQGTIIASTDGTSITWNVAPCNDYSPGDKNDKSAQPQKSAAAQKQSSGNTSANTAVSREYILNTSTKKIHYPDCNSVKQMKDKNKKATTQSRDSLIKQGYSPCGNCKP
ncbi:MAG: MBL fold metallo-hydrolase [Hungatella sp.]|jgi:competence protein ComEC|nr:MBL fold metallo-hydrolase [Hungatella sp.]